MRRIFAKRINLRPIEIVNEWREFKYGVAFTNGDDWKLQRKLMMDSIRNTIHSERIEQAVNLVWKNIKQCLEVTNDKSINPEHFFDIHLADIYLRIMSNVPFTDR